MTTMGGLGGGAGGASDVCRDEGADAQHRAEVRNVHARLRTRADAAPFAPTGVRRRNVVGSDERGGEGEAAGASAGATWATLLPGDDDVGAGAVRERAGSGAGSAGQCAEGDPQGAGAHSPGTTGNPHSRATPALHLHAADLEASLARGKQCSVCGRGVGVDGCAAHGRPACYTPIRRRAPRSRQGGHGHHCDKVVDGEGGQATRGPSRAAIHPPRAYVPCHPPVEATRDGVQCVRHPQPGTGDLSALPRISRPLLEERGLAALGDDGGHVGGYAGGGTPQGGRHAPPIPLGVHHSRLPVPGAHIGDAAPPDTPELESVGALRLTERNRVSDWCPEYARSLETSHPLLEWDYDIVAVVATHVRVLAQEIDAAWQGCDLSEDSETCFVEDPEGHLLHLSSGSDVADSLRRHERMIGECAASVYAVGVARGPSKGCDAALDVLPDSRLNLSVVEEGLNEWERTLLRDYVNEPMLHTTTRKQCQTSSSLTCADLASLVKKGILRVAVGRPHITLPTFKIGKKNGLARLLVDGREFDKRSKPVLPPLTPQLSDLERFVLQHNFFCCVDFLGYFFQIPVGPDLQTKLGIRTTEGYFCFRVAVPGISRAPSVAQLATLGMLQRANLRSVSLAIYDDVCIAGQTLAEVEQRRQAFDATLRDANCVVREEKRVDPTHCAVFIGVQLDMSAKTLALDEDWRSKLLASPTPRTLTCRAVAHHIGCYRWAHLVMRTPIAGFTLMCRLSRQLSRHCTTAKEWDRSVTLTGSLLAEFRRAEKWLAACRPRRVLADAPAWHIWSDASDVGASVVLLDPVARKVKARVDWTWDALLLTCRPPTPIRRRELVTALIAMAVADSVAPRGYGLDCFHDNSTAESRHRKGSSPHPQEDQLMARLMSGISLRRRFTTHLVGTKLMVADLDTR